MIWDLGLKGTPVPLKGDLASRLRGWIDLLKEIQDHAGVIRDSTEEDLADVDHVIGLAYAEPELEWLRTELEDLWNAVRCSSRFWVQRAGPRVDIRLTQGAPQCDSDEWHVPLEDAGRRASRKRVAWYQDVDECLRRTFRCSRADLDTLDGAHRIVLYDPNYVNVLTGDQGNALGAVRRILGVLSEIEGRSPFSCEVVLAGMWRSRSRILDQVSNPEVKWARFVGDVRVQVAREYACDCRLAFRLVPRERAKQQGFAAILNERLLGVARGGCHGSMDWFTLRHDIANPHEVANAKAELEHFVSWVLREEPVYSERVDIAASPSAATGS